MEEFLVKPIGFIRSELKNKVAYFFSSSSEACR